MGAYLANPQSMIIGLPSKFRTWSPFSSCRSPWVNVSSTPSLHSSVIFLANLWAHRRSLGSIQAKLDEIETLKLLAEDEEFDEVIEDMKVAVSDVYDAVKNKVVDVYGDIKDRLSDKGDCEVEIVIEKAEKCDECDGCAPAADEGQDTEVEISSQAEKVGREVAEEIKDGLEGKEE